METYDQLVKWLKDNEVTPDDAKFGVQVTVINSRKDRENPPKPEMTLDEALVFFPSGACPPWTRDFDSKTEAEKARYLSDLLRHLGDDGVYYLSDANGVLWVISANSWEKW